MSHNRKGWATPEHFSHSFFDDSDRLRHPEVRPFHLSGPVIWSRTKYPPSTDSVCSLLAEIVFVQPLRCHVNDVGDGMFSLAVPNSVHCVVQTLLVKWPKH